MTVIAIPCVKPHFQFRVNLRISFLCLDTCLFILLICLTFQPVRLQEQLIRYLSYTELTAAHTRGLVEAPLFLIKECSSGGGSESKRGKSGGIKYTFNKQFHFLNSTNFK
jgi:hypothetical protein